MVRTGKRNKSYICILLICILAAITGCGLFGERNVMEDMYRASIKEGGYSEFKKVEELEIITPTVIEGYTEFGSGFFIPYKKEFLKNNIEVSLFIPDDEHGIEIDGIVRLTQNVQINIYMDYNSENQTLFFKPLDIAVASLDSNKLGTHYEDEESVRKLLNEYNMTEQDIKEYQNYILYDVVMQTWVRRNYYERELTEQDYEDLQIEDHTFDFLS